MSDLRDESVKIQYLIFQAFSVLKKKADTVFRKHGLTGAQVGVLTRLSEIEGKPMNRISEELWCDVSNITGVVDRLDKQGLVWRTAHPEDRRVSLISITPKGKNALAETLPEHEKYLAERINKLSSDERKTLINLLKKIVS
ncbi:MAG: MarR family winged helix-turn-helix transcriptional regulator [Bacillota bacterium]